MHRDDIRQLRHVQQRGDARREILARGRCDGDKRIVIAPWAAREAQPYLRRVARPDVRASARSTFSTPLSAAAFWATASAFDPATRIWTGLPSAFAAVGAFAVAPLSAWLIVLGNKRTAIIATLPLRCAAYPPVRSRVLTLTPAFLVGGSAVFITLIFGWMSMPRAAGIDVHRGASSSPS